MQDVFLGVIGGSGLYDIEDLQIIDRLKIDTPYGKPSGEIIIGAFDKGINIAFLARHGKGHKFLPTEVPYMANIYALKKIGVKAVMSVSAVGSLKKEIEPTHVVVPDQIIDRTKLRKSTYFGDGVVGHIGFADPFCMDMSSLIADSAEQCGAAVHRGATYVCMEGPQFSTRAESHMYRSWGADIIGMTAIPEAKLAREAEICYGTLALATDYDCWHETEDDVSLELVLQYMSKNIILAKKVIKKTAEKFNDKSFKCGCHNTAEFAIFTPKELIPQGTKDKLKLLYGKYWD